MEEEISDSIKAIALACIGKIDLEKLEKKKRM